MPVSRRSSSKAVSSKGSQVATRSVPSLRPIGTHRCLKTSFGGSSFSTSALDVDGVEVHDRQRELLADHLEHVGGGDEPQPHHHVIEPLARAILFVDRLGELLLVD